MTEKTPEERAVPLMVRLPPDIHRELVGVAAEQRRSLNTAVIVAVERYIRQMRARQPREAVDGR